MESKEPRMMTVREVAAMGILPEHALRTLITIMSSLAQEESRSISENVTWGQRKRFADGKACGPSTHRCWRKRKKPAWNTLRRARI